MRKLLLLLTAVTYILAAQTMAGTYKGTFTGAASGDFTMTLAGGDGAWKADVVFTLSGEEIKTKTTLVKVDGDKVNVIYEYDVQGLRLQSNVTGERKGKLIEGTYKATSLPDGAAVDEGTWKVTAQ